MLYLKSVGVWLSFGIVAVLIGALRERLLRPRIGELRSHQVGTMVVCGIIAAIIVFAVRWLEPSPGQALTVGVLWTLLTVGFEIGAFHYVVGVPWERLLADYDVRKGRLWPLVLLTELLGPIVALQLRT